MRKFLIIITLLALMLPVAFFCTQAAGESSGEESGCAISFTRGFYFNNTLTGTESNHLFSGTIPEPITVEEGGSFVFPINTIEFYDYVFVCWKHYDKDRKTVTGTEKYYPGDTYENVTGDLEFGAVWKRPDPIDITITGFLSYEKGDEYAEGKDIETCSVTYGKTIKITSCPYTKDGYDFAGWVDGDGVLYQAGASYIVNRVNPVFTAVWKKDGEAILTHTVLYKGGSGDVSGQGPSTFEMYQKTSFKVAANTFMRDGYAFLYWADAAGDIYYPGEEFKVADDADKETVLTAVWAEVTNSYKITFNITGPGSITPSGDVEVDEGGSYTFNTTADARCRVKSVSINGEKKEIKSSYIIENITADVAVSIIFEEVPAYGVYITCGEGGKAYAEGDVTSVSEGGSVTVHIEPDNGYELKTVNVNGTPAECTEGTVIIDNINQNTTVNVEFIANGADNSKNETSLSSNQSSELEVETPSNSKYVYILAALIVIMVFGFIVFKMKK